MATKKIKDLAPKSAATKGGGPRISANDNMTLVRAAKPTTKLKDLAPKSGAVKGGKKQL